MARQDVPGSNETRQALTPAQAFDMAVTMHRQGRLADAEGLYRAILKLNPQHFGALHYLGMIASAAGKPADAERLIRQALALKDDAAARNNLGIALAALDRRDEAIAEYERAVALDSAHVEARNNLGNELHAYGRSAEAIAHLEKALALRPELADLHNNLANALLAMERREDAIASLRRATELRPDFAEARNNLGFALAGLDRHAEAVGEYERAIALRPRYFEAHNNLANTLVALDRCGEAVPHFESALAITPDAADTRNNFGNVLCKLERHKEAVTHYRKAIESKPDLFEAYNNLGNALAILASHREAIEAYRNALALDPAFADAHCNLGNSLAALDWHDEAIEHYRRALALNPTHADACASLGNTFSVMGRLDEARAALEKAVELAPRRTEFHRNLAESKGFAAGDAQLAAMVSLAASPESFSDGERVSLHFALGKAYTDLGEHDNAFRHLLDGNALKRTLVKYDESRMFAQFERLRAVFTRALFGQKQELGDPSEIPVFIVGMPRSGTTLIEQVLASHSRVLGAGELEHLSRAVAKLERADRGGTPFPEVVPSMSGEDIRAVAADYLAALGPALPPVERITDKMPGNFLFVGLIHLAFPKARIIHARRHPVDTCLSCFSKLFVADALGFTYDLAELGRYYRGYESVMTHWREVLPEGTMLEVQYEELVADFEPQARSIVGYCGLDWEDACLRFHETERPVRTASLTQVRQPIYRSSIGRWLPYKDMLMPLLKELEVDLP